MASLAKSASRRLWYKLELMKITRYTTPVAKFEDYSMHYLAVPPKAVKALGGKFRARLVCSLNGSKAFHCGLNPLGEGQGYLTLSKQRMAELGLGVGDTVKVELAPDNSKYGMPVPPEFREVLRQDEEGKRRFAKLKPGKQRTLLHYVAGTVNVDLRIERSLKLLTNLKGLEEGRETIPALFGKSSRPGAGRW
jgi:hypothetical protein